MIRLSTLISAGIAAMAGLYLYHVKYQTQMLDRSIVQINQTIDATRDRMEVLRAEWTLLNDPERLSALAGQFLSLGTVAPKQFTALADLPNRLPPPQPMAPAPTATTDEPADTGTEPVAEAPLPLPPPFDPAPAGTVLAHASSPVALPAAAPNNTRAPITPARPRVVAPSTPPSVTRVSLSAPPPRAQPSAIYAGAQRAGTRPPPVPVSTPVPTPVSAPSPSPVASASALGMARNIVAPPVPMGDPATRRHDSRSDIRYVRGN